MSKKVYIGVGHGGADPGAVAQGFRESDLALRVSLHCDKALRDIGIITMISRISDISFPAAQKVPQANAFNPDVSIDIHFNAGGGRGCESFHKPGNANEIRLSNILCRHVSALGLSNRGAKPSQGSFSFGMVLSIRAVANLFECAFVDSADKQFFDTDEKLQSIGVAIAKGICEYLGVTFTEKPVEKPAGLFAVVRQTTALSSLEDARAEAARLNNVDKSSFFYVVPVDEIRPLRL